MYVNLHYKLTVLTSQSHLKPAQEVYPCDLGYESWCQIDYCVVD